VTKFPRRHAVHQTFNGVVFGAGLYVTRHHLTDRLIQCCRPLFCEHAHDITFRQDADDAMIGAKDDNCTDAPLAQQLYRCSEICIGLKPGNPKASD
jgi:hypothetical protein